MMNFEQLNLAYQYLQALGENHEICVEYGCNCLDEDFDVIDHARDLILENPYRLDRFRAIAQLDPDEYTISECFDYCVDFIVTAMELAEIKERLTYDQQLKTLDLVLQRID